MTSRPVEPRRDTLGRGGRPRDEELTARLLATAVDVLAEGGMALLTVDRVAARTGAGRPAVYRRWPDLHHLAADALRSCTLVPAAPPTGSLAGDLAALMHPWTRDPDRGERAAATLVGEAHTSLVVHTALDEVVRRPLTAAVTRAVAAERARGRAVPDGREAWVDRVLTALWWSRYVEEPAPLSGREVHDLVERALLPVLHAPQHD